MSGDSENESQLHRRMVFRGSNTPCSTRTIRVFPSNHSRSGL